MADWEMSAEEYQAEWDSWYKEYEITDFIENSEENWAKVQEMDPHLVWTDHSTCEDPRVSNGAHMFKSSCCWETHGWYIGAKPWEGGDDAYIAINTGAYLPCPKCNVGGEGDGDPDCDEEDCDDGFINYWFD